MQVTVGSATDVGRVRSGNEDAFLARLPVLAVADGMGGHAAGEVASALTVAALSELVGRSGLAVEDVVRQLGRANATILASAREHPEQEGMGTTVAGVALLDGADGDPRWAVFNVGDSRVYEHDGSGLTQVTVDHSLVQELVEAGVLSAEQAARHPSRNVVTRSLGREPMVDVSVATLPCRPGQRLVVCSDGLSDELTPAALDAVLRSAPGAEQAATALVQAALEAGGHDNVTVLVIDVTD
jgi:serine/threonine protein phosphatase PrpC